MSLCPGQPQAQGFIGAMTRFVDCQSEALGSGAWQALSLSGSTLQLVLTGFLTIFIALIGYNLLLGRSMTVRSGTIAMVKIGFVFALATSWPAWRTLVYDLVTDGPQQIVREIGPAARIPGSDGTLVQRLDGADGALVRLAVLGTGHVAAFRQDLPPPPFAGFNAFALGGSRILFLITAIAGLSVVRIVTGLALALGPFFVAFLMFDSTRSLFESWVRVLGGAALAAIGVSIALGLELALMEPWLSGLLARRIAGEALPSVPTELFVVSSVFALVVLAVLVASARLARAFRLAPLLVQRDEVHAPVPAGSLSVFRGPAAIHRDEERSRAAAVRDVLVALQHRESAGRAVARGGRVPALAPRGDQAGSDHPGHPAVGRAFARRARPRVSASAGRRDQLR